MWAILISLDWARTAVVKADAPAMAMLAKATRWRRCILCLLMMMAEYCTVHASTRSPPRLAHFVSLSTPSPGAIPAAGGAGSAGFLAAAWKCPGSRHVMCLISSQLHYLYSG